MRYNNLFFLAIALITSSMTIYGSQDHVDVNKVTSFSETDELHCTRVHRSGSIDTWSEKRTTTETHKLETRDLRGPRWTSWDDETLPTYSTSLINQKPGGKETVKNQPQIDTLLTLLSCNEKEKREITNQLTLQPEEESKELDTQLDLLNLSSIRQVPQSVTMLSESLKKATTNNQNEITPLILKIISQLKDVKASSTLSVRQGEPAKKLFRGKHKPSRFNALTTAPYARNSASLANRGNFRRQTYRR